MKFFFDESGRFTVPSNPNALCASVVAGVVISESVETQFKSDFEEWLNSLPERERTGAEAKGRLLGFESRKRFCAVVNKYARRGIILTPTLVDMAVVSQGTSFFSVERFAQHLKKLAASSSSDEARLEITNVAELIEGLSNPQGWRLHTWALAFLKAIKNAISWLCSDGNENCWENIRFEVDEVDTRKDGLEKKVFLRLLRSWLSAYSRQDPFEFHDDIHTPDNPFVLKFETEGGFDLEKMLEGNIFFCDSNDSLGIQVADVAANIILQAAHLGKNANHKLALYAELMESCPYPPNEGPGLVFASSSDLHLLSSVRQKYDHLFTSLAHRRESL